MLGHRLQRSPNISPLSVEILVLSVFWLSRVDSALAPIYDPLCVPGFDVLSASIVPPLEMDHSHITMPPGRILA